MTEKEQLAEIGQQLAKLTREVSELTRLVRDQRTVKETYTVEEASKRTGVSAYTLRECCRTGRIAGKKGTDDRWRIPHETLVALQNEGLPPKTSA